MIPALHGRNRAERRAAVLQLERDNKLYPEHLVLQAVEPGHGRPLAAWRSREFLVQVYEEGGGVFRLSVCRTHVDPATLEWRSDISWEELQALKRQCGFGDREAVEIYPPDAHVVHVANMRHLWVLPEPLPFS